MPEMLYRKPIAVVLCLLIFRPDVLAARGPQTASRRAHKSAEIRPVDTKPMEAKIDAIFAPLTDAKKPGFAVLVRKDGHVVLERGYGACDLRSFAEIDAHSNFRLASFTKQFTAMSIMLLIHSGKLRYESTLTEVFPDFPAYGRSIPIRDRLTHPAGLPDYEGLMDPAQKRKGAPIWSATRQIQDAEVLQLLEHETHGKFSSGTKWSYSNSGYVVLGLVAAKVSGKPFREVLRERIFAPLHMDQTVAYEKGKNEIAQRAYGHTQEGSIWRETDQSPTSATLGDGGIYSNLKDLTKWDDALARHTLLSETDMQPALAPVVLADGSQPSWPADAEPNDDNLHPGQPVAYGFGWFLDPYRDRPRMYHHGGTIGFRTYITRFTKDNLTIVVLCNRTDMDPESLALRVADLYLAPTEAHAKLNQH